MAEQTIAIINSEGASVGTASLSPQVFNIEPNRQVMYEAVRSYLANQRQGTASTKGRAEVSGGGKKPWRQKGTGRARSGTTRSPVWVGGGIVFGPKPRSYRTELPKKINLLARRSAFSLQAREGKIKVLEDVVFDAPKTKRIASMLAALDLKGKKVLFLPAQASEHLLKSCRNIPHLMVRRAGDVPAYDLLNCEMILLTRSGLAQIEEVLGS